jgi:carbonic anhydrase
METVPFLRKYVDGARTLVITCLECCIDIEQLHQGEVFRFTALGNMVDVHDTYQMQTIRSFVTFKNCSRIIVAGHTDCKVLGNILQRDVSEKSTLNELKGDLQQLYNDNHCYLFRSGVRDRVLIEQNIIAQCRTLLAFEPFREKLNEGTLEIIGLLLNTDGESREIFSHGVSYNHIIGMN